MVSNATCIIDDHCASIRSRRPIVGGLYDFQLLLRELWRLCQGLLPTEKFSMMGPTQIAPPAAQIKGIKRRDRCRASRRADAINRVLNRDRIFEWDRRRKT